MTGISSFIDGRDYLVIDRFYVDHRSRNLWVWCQRTQDQTWHKGWGFMEELPDPTLERVEEWREKYISGKIIDLREAMRCESVFLLHFLKALKKPGKKRFFSSMHNFSKFPKRFEVHVLLNADPAATLPANGQIQRDQDLESCEIAAKFRGKIWNWSSSNGGKFRKI